MAILDIVYYGDPRLEQLSEPVEEVTPELRRFIKDMFETMYFTNGVGLSAPQVGVNQRILVIDCSGGSDRSQQITMINPVITVATGEQKGPEGCLSFPGLFAEVTRPNIVSVKGLNLDGNEVEVEGEGLLARALHHEIDHLDGVLFIQRMRKADREAIVKKMKKFKVQKTGKEKDKVLV
jgi:peptide deformylase